MRKLFTFLLLAAVVFWAPWSVPACAEVDNSMFSTVHAEDLFRAFAERTFLLVQADGPQAVKVLADGQVNVWSPHWYFYGSLKVGESFRLEERGADKIFTLAQIRKDGAVFNYKAKLREMVKGREEIYATEGVFEVLFSKPWEVAAYLGNNDVIKKNISEGLSPDVRDRFGRTPLMLAAFCGNEEICRTLLFSKAQVNAFQNEGLTALMLAMRHPKIVELLISYGADVNARDRQGRCALFYAVKYPASLKQLLDKKAVVRGPAADEALFWAVRFGDPLSVKLLIEAGADVNARVGRKSLVRWAMQDRRDEAAGYLLRAGARE